MIQETIQFHRVPFLSKKDISYQTEFEKWREFASCQAHIDAFEELIENRKKYNVDRHTLVDVLEVQYNGLEVSDLVRENIRKLRSEKTFTIITAHQPSILTGPLYYIFKICSVINLCKQLKHKNPEYDFVPMFISGGEDHDFEEINHINVFNNDFVWEHSHQGEPVSHLDNTGLETLVDQIREKMNEGSDASDFLDFVKETISKVDKYGELVLSYVNYLFGRYGLVFLNMDNKALKSNFIEIIKEEIIKRPSEDLVRSTQQLIESNGFKAQAFVREINFFYITKDGLRKRIELVEDKYHILDTEINYTELEILREIEEYPERFSPNVVMRPIYQEFSIPNLAYVGGGGEIAYWLERKSQFQHFNVPFPMLIRRNSALLLDKGIDRNINKLEMRTSTFFQDEHKLIDEYLEKNEENEIELESEKQLLNTCFDQIKDKAKVIDQSLTGKIDSELAKSMKVIEQLEYRLRKSTKEKHQVNLDRIKTTYERIFPGNSLQERKVNFLEFLNRHGYAMLSELITLLNPLDKQFLIIDLDKAD